MGVVKTVLITEVSSIQGAVGVDTAVKTVLITEVFSIQGVSQVIRFICSLNKPLIKMLLHDKGEMDPLNKDTGGGPPHNKVIAI